MSEVQKKWSSSKREKILLYQYKRPLILVDATPIGLNDKPVAVCKKVKNFEIKIY